MPPKCVWHLRQNPRSSQFENRSQKNYIIVWLAQSSVLCRIALLLTSVSTPCFTRSRKRYKKAQKYYPKILLYSSHASMHARFVFWVLFSEKISHKPTYCHMCTYYLIFFFLNLDWLRILEALNLHQCDCLTFWTQRRTYMYDDEVMLNVLICRLTY